MPCSPLATGDHEDEVAESKGIVLALEREIAQPLHGRVGIRTSVESPKTRRGSSNFKLTHYPLASLAPAVVPC